MTPKEYKERYGGLTNAQVRELIRTDAGFRSATEELYVATFRAQLNKSCSECWMDAYVLLMRTEITELMEKAKTQFELKAGALLIDVVAYDNAKMATRHNLTDELALYHLSTCPDYRRYFSKVPDNLDDLLADYKAKLAVAEDGSQGDGSAPLTNAKGEDDKTLIPDGEKAQNGQKSPEEALSEAAKAVKKARTVAKSAATKLSNLENADTPDEKKIAYARESRDKAVKALEEAEAAYQAAAEAAGQTGESGEEAQKTPDTPEDKPAEGAE